MSINIVETSVAEGQISGGSTIGPITLSIYANDIKWILK